MMMNPDIHIMLSHLIITLCLVAGRISEFLVNISPVKRTTQGTGIIRVDLSISPGNKPSNSMYKDKAPVLSPNIVASMPGYPIDVVLNTLLSKGQRYRKLTNIVRIASKKRNMN